MLISCIDQNAPGPVADRFAYAFIDADIEKARSVAVPEQWDRIERLMAGRQPFNCRDGDWETSGLSSVGGHTPNTEEWTYSHLYRCTSQRTPYCLAIDDIVVRRVEGRWLVHDWGKIREASSYDYPCGGSNP